LRYGIIRDRDSRGIVRVYIPEPRGGVLLRVAWSGTTATRRVRARQWKKMEAKRGGEDGEEVSNGIMERERPGTVQVDGNTIQKDGNTYKGTEIDGDMRWRMGCRHWIRIPR
jgi:hypothetical protein